MNPARLTIAVLAPVLLVLGCAALGWRFGPGFSSRDVGLFATPPIIERRADGAFLTWTYGDSAFFFQPGYRTIDGRLVFSLQGSSSSGDVRGRRGEVRIEGAESLAALETGGAVWWEPDGSYLAIEVVDLAAKGSPPVVLFYEVGVRGVRGGMTTDEVKQALGPPASTVAEQYFGSFRWRYDDGTSVLFWDNVAAGIEGR